MKTYPRLIQKLFCEPLLVLPSTYATFERALLQRLGLPFASDLTDPHVALVSQARVDYANPELGKDEPKEARADTPGERNQRRVNRIVKTYGSVAVITIDGVIDKRISDFEMDCYGGVDLNDIDSAISQVASNKDVRTVVFDINSPGGSSTGVAETAERIRVLGANLKDGGARKETIARVDMLCCSAAQWLASQCDTISGTPSATFGSIGVYCALVDQSGWLEQNGLKVNLIKAGKYKAMGAPFKALEDEERELLQGRIDNLHTEFKAAITSKRAGVADSTMQGQSFRSDEARKLKLIDEISPESLDEYVGMLRSRSAPEKR